MNDQEHAEIVRQLSDLILKAVPKAQSVDKYGGTLYTLKPDEKEGQFCGLFQYKSHVHLAFSQGTQLKDANGILEGNGKLRRHITIKNMQDINAAALNSLIKQAAKLSI